MAARLPQAELHSQAVFFRLPLLVAFLFSTTWAVANGSGNFDDDDPLAAFLHSLVLKIANPAPVTTSGITLDLEDVMLKELTIGHIATAVADVTQPGKGKRIGIDVTGMMANLEMDFTYTGVWPVGGSGHLKADLLKESKISIAFDLLHDGDVAAVPEHASNSACEVSLSIVPHFDGWMRILNMFSGLVGRQISSSVQTQVCTEMKTIAEVNMTKAIKELNKLMLPPELVAKMEEKPVAERRATQTTDAESSGDFASFSAASDTSEIVVEDISVSAVEDFERASTVLGSSPLDLHIESRWSSWLEDRVSASFLQADTAGQADEPPESTLDWKNVEALQWLNWLAKDVLGVKRINQLVADAVLGTHTLVLHGPDEPVASIAADLKASSLHLTVNVTFLELVITNVDTLRSFETVTAVDEDRVKLGMEMGTDDRPDWGISFAVKADVDAVDQDGVSKSKKVSQLFNMSIGLSKPGIYTTIKLLIDDSKLSQAKTVAQWYFDAVNCSLALLGAAPEIDDLNITFAAVAEPLAVKFLSIGQLEKDLTDLIENIVALFNGCYMQYLPGAIHRNAGSKEFLSRANAFLMHDIKPATTTCIGSEAAADKVKSLPKTFQSWPMVINEEIERLVNNAIDGFLRQNISDFSPGIENMPMFWLKPMDSPPVETYVTFGLNGSSLLFDGTERITKLRGMQTDPLDPKQLSFSVEVACPSDEKPYRPRMRFAGEFRAEDETNLGEMVTEAPCGHIELATDVVLDVHRIMALTVPPKPACVLTSFSSLHLSKLSMAYSGSGDFFLAPGEDGHFQSPLRPLQEFMESFPRAVELLKSVAEKKLTLEQLNTVLVNFLKDVEALCDSQSVAEFRKALLPHMLMDMGGLHGDDRNRDSFGFMALDLNTIIPGTITSLVALAGVFIGLVIREAKMGSRQSTSSSERKSCLSILLDTKTNALAQATVTCIVLAAIIVMQFLSLFMLPFCLCYLNVLMDAAHGKVASVYVDRFSFLGVARNFWITGSQMACVLWQFLPIGLGGATTLVLMLFWFTSYLPTKRRQVLRTLIVGSRAAIVSTPTLLLAAEVMMATVKMPLGQSLDIKVDLMSGFYLCALATLTQLALLQYFLGLLPDSGEANTVASIEALSPAAPETKSHWMQRAAHMACWLSLLVGLVAFTFFDFMTSSPTEVLGTLLNPTVFKGFSILGTHDVFLMIVTFLTAFVGPLLQLIMEAPGVSTSSWGWTPAAKAVREFAHGFSFIDVLAGMFWTTFIVAMGPFAGGSMEVQFGAVCDAFEMATSERCLGLDVEPHLIGGGGLALCFFGSFGLMTLHAIRDIQDARRRCGVNVDAQETTAELSAGVTS
eukprot:TRINITY_DN42613_c0_g1_i1.p1 TRINITY_DN42613_c0_g1~~TRINITY_DN42613_c0_g1_i1.p1  ORF type:complete len:1343 (-),score=279.46 TRINITY_DN42613_c0_g1_i1:199-4227(-)